jgi:EAL domain-containing protein (putative c-di-GMP-specific phosphodiesterase class I)/GGDEF domain-containing protein
MMPKMFLKFSWMLLALLLILAGSLVPVYANETNVPLQGTMQSAKPEAVVYVAGNPDHYPIEYFDEKEHVFKGIVPDLLKLVSEKTGIQFIYMDESSDRENLIKNLQVDMVSDYQFNQKQVEAYNLTLSEKIFSFPTEQGTENIYAAYTTIADPIVVSRINDALQSITSEQKEQILLSKIPDEPSYLHTKVDTIIIVLLCVSVALLFLMIFFVREYKKRLEYQIHSDSMTGYGNHIQLFKDYAAIITDENRCSYSVVDLKIENFSYIREVHGYEERNYILTQFSQVIQSQLSEDELFARISDGNFILVVQYISQQRLTQRLDQLYIAIQNMMQLESKDYTVLLKSGIYYLANHDKDLNQAIYYAIQARRYAQNNNLSYAIYDEMVCKSSNLVKELDQEVIAGLDNNEFVPYFQPAVEVTSSKIVVSEVLSRWHNKKRGLMFPGEFIPILEKNGLLGKMDFTLFRHVCELLEQRANENKELIRISCNFSRYSFYQPDFCTTLKEIAQEHQVPTGYLEIEITENITAENIPGIISKINELKSYGFTVALDNFGGGYSSIMDLRNCSIDIVKLDKELINDIQNPKTQSIVKSIVDMCHDIGVQVACEGIETEEQLQLLKQVNCDFAQGYFFYQPMPYSELDKLMDS